MTVMAPRPEILLLRSNQLKEVISAVKAIRKSGSVKEIPSIIESLSSQSRREARIEIITLLSDIKTPDAVEQFILALQNLSDDTTLIDIVRVCWESCLDFSPHLDFFADLFTQGSYELAVECFTVIENTVLAQNIPSENLQSIVNNMLRNIHQMSPEKQVFAQTLIEFLAVDPD